MEDIRKGLTEENILIFDKRKESLLAMGGQKMIQKQHDLGKLTARERIDHLFDPGSFQEVQLFVKHRSVLFGLGGKEIPADGVITGFGLINGWTVFAAAQDFTSAGGSLGEMHAKKIWKVMGMALDARKPFIALNDSGGARIQEGVPALEGYGGIFYRNTLGSGCIPQITAVMGVTVCGVWVATQWTAHALGYQPRLGVAWFDLSGLPVYEPWKLFEWWYWYDAYAPEVFSRGGAIAASSGLLATGVAIGMAVWRSASTGTPCNSHR